MTVLSDGRWLWHGYRNRKCFAALTSLLGRGISIMEKERADDDGLAAEKRREGKASRAEPAKSMFQTKQATGGIFSQAVSSVSGAVPSSMQGHSGTASPLGGALSPSMQMQPRARFEESTVRNAAENSISLLINQTAANFGASLGQVSTLFDELHWRDRVLARIWSKGSVLRSSLKPTRCVRESLRRLSPLTLVLLPCQRPETTYDTICSITALFSALSSCRAMPSVTRPAQSRRLVGREGRPVAYTGSRGDGAAAKQQTRLPTAVGRA